MFEHLGEVDVEAWLLELCDRLPVPLLHAVSVFLRGDQIDPYFVWFLSQAIPLVLEGVSPHQLDRAKTALAPPDAPV